MNSSRAVPGATALLMLCLEPLAARAALSDAASAVEALSKVRDFEQVAISPDGSQVAWVELLRDASGAPSRNTAIYCKSRNDAAAKPNRISVASGRDAKEHDLAWAPASRQIAFLSDAENPGTPQLYPTDCSGLSGKQLVDRAAIYASLRRREDNINLQAAIANRPTAMVSGWQEHSFHRWINER